MRRLALLSLLSFTFLFACRAPAPAAPEVAVEVPVEPPAEAHAEAPTEPPVEAPSTEVVDETPKLVLTAVDAGEIPGYEEDDLSKAVGALLRSCGRLVRRPRDRPVGPDALAGTVADWLPICAAARKVTAGDRTAARAFFDRHFKAYAVSDRDDSEGRFTGYYEASMRGSRRKRGRFVHPVYARPPELVMVELKDFHAAPTPRRISGKVVDGRLRRYYTRKEIDEGALAGRGLELFWVDSAVDRLFTQIQGSGIVKLGDGSEVRLGYAGKTGHPYTAIGRELVREGAIKASEMSMQAIRGWLEANPDRATEMMQRNEAYVFFEIARRPGAIGAQNVVLTPERSMAVDPYFIPLSSPIFVDSEIPDPEGSGSMLPFRQMVIAQDTGGAIRGPVRGDLFWGAGERAAAIAGRLKSAGRYYLFLPASVAPDAESVVVSSPGS